MQHLKLSKLLAVTSAIIAFNAPVMAEDVPAKLPFPGTLSTTLSLSSDYVFRGISQTDGTAAIQGSFDYAHPEGFYAGIWGSNVNFNDGNEASIELDGYVGFTKTVNAFTGDVRAIYYAYPGAASSLHYDYWEGYVAASYDFKVASVTTSLNYTPENFGRSGAAYYPRVSVKVPLPSNFSLEGGIGHQFVEKNDVLGLPDYTDWLVGIGYKLYGIDLRLQYTDSNLSKNECASACGSRVIISASKTF